MPDCYISSFQSYRSKSETRANTNAECINARTVRRVKGSALPPGNTEIIKDDFAFWLCIKSEDLH